MNTMTVDVADGNFVTSAVPVDVSGYVSMSGARSSEAKPRYDLCYHGALKRWAQRMSEGARAHGEKNYLLGVGDVAYRRERMNHLIEHVLLFAAGDRTDDHLGAIMANCGIIAELDDAARK